MSTSVIQTCLYLRELTAAAQTACRLLFQECLKAGIEDVFITRDIAVKHDKITCMSKDEQDQGK
ncbi:MULTISPECIES: hypothetical protein [Lysinibacillus]|uniref:hypothetical protein n=1 Tax=Lysinibacillus TaxID=400634 RepID=UPI001EDA9D85|nr:MULTISPECIES: hypothetical protein [Lysinibacillus]UKJ47315.1 hypothetical protein L6W14_09780 [Lysinibacillus sp. ACHW1.5]